VDGRDTLLTELKSEEQEVCRYIAEQFVMLLEHSDFEYAVQGNLQQSARSELFFYRWEQICDLSGS